MSEETIPLGQHNILIGHLRVEKTELATAASLYNRAVNHFFEERAAYAASEKLEDAEAVEKASSMMDEAEKRLRAALEKHKQA